MGVAVLAQLDADPVAVHFMGDCSGGARAEEGVEDKVTGFGGKGEDALDEAFWFRGCKNIILIYFFYLLFCLLGMSYFIVRPPSPRDLSLLF